MNRIILSLIFCVSFFGCDKVKDDEDYKLTIDDVLLPIADSPYTYHGPRGEGKVLFVINKDDNLNLVTAQGEDNINPSHNSAVNALNLFRSSNDKLRIRTSAHIYLDRRATSKQVTRVYKMIEDSKIAGYVFAAKLEDSHGYEEYPQTYALVFNVPSIEIRSRLKMPNP